MPSRERRCCCGGDIDCEICKCENCSPDKKAPCCFAVTFAFPAPGSGSPSHTPSASSEDDRDCDCQGSYLNGRYLLRKDDPLDPDDCRWYRRLQSSCSDCDEKEVELIVEPARVIVRMLDADGVMVHEWRKDYLPAEYPDGPPCCYIDTEIPLKSTSGYCENDAATCHVEALKDSNEEDCEGPDPVCCEDTCGCMQITVSGLSGGSTGSCLHPFCELLINDVPFKIAMAGGGEVADAVSGCAWVGDMCPEMPWNGFAVLGGVDSPSVILKIYKDAATDEFRMWAEMLITVYVRGGSSASQTRWIRWEKTLEETDDDFVCEDFDELTLDFLEQLPYDPAESYGYQVCDARTSTLKVTKVGLEECDNVDDPCREISNVCETASWTDNWWHFNTFMPYTWSSYRPRTPGKHIVASQVRVDTSPSLFGAKVGCRPDGGPIDRSSINGQSFICELDFAQVEWPGVTERDAYCTGLRYYNGDKLLVSPWFTPSCGTHPSLGWPMFCCESFIVTANALWPNVHIFMPCHTQPRWYNRTDLKATAVAGTEPTPLHCDQVSGDIEGMIGDTFRMTMSIGSNPANQWCGPLGADPWCDYTILAVTEIPWYEHVP